MDPGWIGGSNFRCPRRGANTTIAVSVLAPNARGWRGGCGSVGSCNSNSTGHTRSKNQLSVSLSPPPLPCVSLCFFVLLLPLLRIVPCLCVLCRLLCVAVLCCVLMCFDPLLLMLMLCAVRTIFTSLFQHVFIMITHKCEKSPGQRQKAPAVELVCVGFVLASVSDGKIPRFMHSNN